MGFVTFACQIQVFYGQLFCWNSIEMSIRVSVFVHMKYISQGVGYIRQQVNNQFLKLMCYQQGKWASEFDKG